MDYVNKNSIITWGNVFVVDHNLAISVGTTELVEEAQQVHDELHNIGLGGITVQMDVLDTSKTARQAVSRATVNKREMIIINPTGKHCFVSELDSKQSSDFEKSSKFVLPFYFFLLHLSLNTFSFKIKEKQDYFMLNAFELTNNNKQHLLKYRIVKLKTLTLTIQLMWKQRSLSLVF